MKIKKILVIALVIAIPVFTWFSITNQETLRQIGSLLSDGDVLIALAFSSLLLLAAHIIRAFKTKFLTDNIKRTSWRTHTRALFIGYLFNTLLPFRIGELIRAIVLGTGTKMSSTFMFGMVLLDRAFDGIILGAFALLLATHTNMFDGARIHGLVLFAGNALMIGGILIIGLLLIIRTQPAWVLKLWHRFTAIFVKDIRDDLRFKMWSLMYGLERVIIGPRMLRYLALSVVMWGVYLAAILPLTLSFTDNRTSTQLTADSTVSYLGVSAPKGPAYIGSYENFVQPYVDAQSDPQPVRSALIIVWLMQMLPVFLIGLVFVLRTTESLKRPLRGEPNHPVQDKLLRDVDHAKNLGTFLDAFFTNNSLSRIMHRFEVDNKSKLVHYFKGGSNAITALVHENDRLIVRKITPIQYKYKLKSQYDWLKDKTKLEKIVNVIDEESTNDYYKIDLEYNQDYVPYFDYIHSMPVKNSKKILSQLYEYLFKNVYKFGMPAHRPKDLEAYIRDRYLDKINQAAKVNDEIRSLLTYGKLTINGQSYDNIPLVIERIKANPAISKMLATYRKCSVHGDPTVDNLLVSKKTHEFLLIDPTDNENEISGPVFDFGRTGESLYMGYEFLCRDDRHVQVDGNVIEFENSTSGNYSELAKHMQTLQKKYLTEDEQNSVMFHVAVLYGRMLTHRVQINPLNAVKFYAVSVIALNDFMDQVEAKA